MMSWGELVRDYHHALGEDGEPDAPTFANRGVVRRHTARRPGPCERCPIGRGVQPGERYAVHVGLDQDNRDFFYERHCEAMPDACRAAMPGREDPHHAAVTYGLDAIPF